jgi:NADH:ubiquinone oxidoreductase subunit 2 (subunit N)
MISNIQEFYSIVPLIIIGGVILVSVTIEMFTEKSEKTIGWISIITFLITGIYSITFVEQTGVTMQGMLATGGIVNIFWFIFNVSAAIVCLLSIDYLKKYGSNCRLHSMYLQDLIEIVLQQMKQLLSIFFLEHLLQDF